MAITMDRIDKKELPLLVKNFAEELITYDWQGTPYHIAPHHEEWLKLWAEHPLLLILAARGHGKTETMVVLPILWIMANMQNQLIHIVSSSLDQAELILDRIKTIVERWMPKYIDRNNWAKQQIKTTTGIMVIAKGVCNRIIGPHPQWIFVDDPIEDKQTIPDSEIEKWFFASLFPMLAKNGHLMVIGTFKHFADVFHTIIERELFHVSIHPAFNEDGSLLWPEYWTKDMLDERRQALGSVLFAREYMLQPVDETSSMFPMGLITECFDPDLPLTKKYEGEYEVYVGVDPAASGSIGADYSVFSIVAYDREEGTRILLDLIREKGVTLQDHISMLRFIDEAYSPVNVKIEKNAFQRWLEQEATHNLQKIPITGHITGKEKSDLREGVPALRLLMEKGLLIIPRGRTEAEIEKGIKEWECNAVKTTDPLVEELNAMTWESGKMVSVAKHDDTVMSMWLCNLAIEEGKKDRDIGMTFVDTSTTAKPKSIKDFRRRIHR